MNEVVSIPTNYNGITYRSLLEARWAYIFDQLGWKYEYEPIEMSGYIPDFIIFAHDDIKILVEVKPFTSLDEFYDNKVISKIISAVQKYPYKSKFEILLLGSTINIPNPFSNYSIGWCGEPTIFCHIGEKSEKPSKLEKNEDEFDYYVKLNEAFREDERDIWCEPAVLNCYNNKYGYFHSYGSYRDRLTGLWDGDHLLRIEDDIVLKSLWNNSNNILGYKKRRLN